MNLHTGKLAEAERVNPILCGGGGGGRVDFNMLRTLLKLKQLY